MSRLSNATIVDLAHLKPNPGSHIKKQRIGRGGRRGGSSGRGQGGQKHHANRPAPWFTGLYTNPIVEALPRWPWAPRELKPIYCTLNLDRLQHWIELGRLDASKLITIADMVRSGLVGSSVRDGVKLLARGDAHFQVPNLQIEVSKCSLVAAETIEKCGGTVTTVYHTRRGLECLLHPERYPLKPYFERPVLEADIAYYSDPIHRGYLADRERFEREYKPRGYIADEQMERQMLSERQYHRVEQRFQVEDVQQRLEELRSLRKRRQVVEDGQKESMRN
jgi:large subunit ribosomal protein L15